MRKGIQLGKGGELYLHDDAHIFNIRTGKENGNEKSTQDRVNLL